MSTSYKRKMTQADHQVNHLKKQATAYVRIIGELQEALRIERDRVMRAEASESGIRTAVEILEVIARAAVAELPEERRAHWFAQFPGLARGEGENGMKVVWKYLIPGVKGFSLSLPIGAQVLTVEKVANEWCVYALVDPTVGTTLRAFRIVDTGQEWDAEGWRYVGTIIVPRPKHMDEESTVLVHHLFTEDAA